METQFFSRKLQYGEFGSSQARACVWYKGEKSLETTQFRKIILILIDKLEVLISRLTGSISNNAPEPG